MMRVPVVIACALIALAVAPVARADVTIGSTLTAVPGDPLDCQPAGCTVSGPIPGPQATTVPGVITRWRIRTGNAVTPVALQVVRRPSGTGAPGFEVGRSALVTPPANAPSRLYRTRIPVEGGDYLAIECCATGPGSFFAPATGAIRDSWTPPLAGLTARTPSTTVNDQELLVNADIEPDDDADEYGDETQDNCPGLANPGQADLDRDDLGDACDDDRDGDTRANATDNCPDAANVGQENADGDATGDACDADRDGDGVLNDVDTCPGLAGATASGCPAPPSASPAPRPPVVRFRTPLAGTGIGPALRIELDVFDDGGAPVVSVFDDDGTICVLRASPYACTWTPTGADVGRATLLASAVDAGGLSSLAIVRVRVNRFAATVTRKVRRRGRRVRVSGRLALPAAVERALGCRGNVTVRVRRVRRTVSLTRRCTYVAQLRARSGRPRVRFAGNSVVAPT